MLCSKCNKRPAVVFITNAKENTSTEGLCLTCARAMGIKPLDNLMKSLGINSEEFDAMTEQLQGMIPMPEDDAEPDDFNDFTPGGAATFPFLQNIFAESFGVDNKEDTNQNSKTSKKQGSKSRRKYLDTYCTNLTKKAREGRIDKIIGRDKEIDRVIQILSRRTKNNPCLIGEPGVGKTAIAEGIAIRISKKQVPVRLRDKELHLLDLTALVAGTQFRGQFESRIKGLVQEVKQAKNVILFIDEVHNLVGTGDSEGTMNAANMLKPALSRGEIQVIGATTFGEYRKHIEKDSALERRFQPVTIVEPSIEETCLLLKGIKSYYESFHRVSVEDKMIKKIVVLSERYITDRFLPDKAIDLLDESCAYAALTNKDLAAYDKLGVELKNLMSEEKTLSEKTEDVDYEKLASVRCEIAKIGNTLNAMQEKAIGRSVLEEHVAHVIELWTGIPASKIKENELSKLAKIEERLKSHIIGQDEAVHLLSAAIKRNRVQISPRRRPASFIFVGPTGVGKTELVKTLASELFDSPETLIRLDMSEFMEKHAVSRIIGSPPGYVGYDEAGQITEKVRHQPYSVILLDEIEKAHPDVMNLLLQILDEGKINDSKGRTINFENTVIIMTSNAGSDKQSSSLGFAKTSDDISKEKAMKALKDFLRPEFLSRIDEIVVFRNLKEDDFEKIASLMLEEYIESLEEKSIEFSYEKGVLKFLAKKSFGGKHGARDLRNLIRREVEDIIASLLIENNGNDIKKIKLIVKNENLELKVL